MNRQLDEESVFHVAREIPAGKGRDAYLTQACSDDERLKTRVEALLVAYEEEQGFLRSAEADLPSTQAADATVGVTVGQKIGRYKLLQAIGEGGMGMVFMADQSRPVSRRVALKIIKPGMDSKAVIARFEAERQALAMMDHPNIAKVFDAGSTDSGHPFFVMELVKGVSITKYCDDYKLPIEDRLELFVQVCQAVQHAHQKGVIHRDIKPSNVLVAKYDDKPVPKVIDFGVAKAISQKLTERTMFTQFGQIVGTLEYMSPEQAQFNQLDVDTRSDIYSLGVLLYELLVGVTPFDRQRLRASAYDEVIRILRDEEPPKPSTRFSMLGVKTETVSANRASATAKLRLNLRGDLDWIVMKSLAKDRDARYESANLLGRDVSEHLNGNAVSACPPSAAYMLRKYWRRHRIALNICLAVAIALIAFAANEVWKTRQLQSQLCLRDVASAQSAFDNNDYDGMVNLLLRHLPTWGGADNRGFEWFVLWELCARAIRTPDVALEDPGISGAFSPDGSRFAVGCMDNQVQIVETRSHRIVETINVGPVGKDEDGRHWVKAIAYSPDGRSLAIRGTDNSILLRNMESGDTIDLDGHTDIVQSLQFSKDGHFLCSGGRDGRVILWDVHQRKPKQEFGKHQKPVYAVAMSPDGETIASVDTNGQVWLWNLKEPKGDLLTEDADGMLYGGAIAFSPDSKSIACATSQFGNHQVMVLSVKGNANGRPLKVFGHHEDEIRGMSFHPHDSNLLATGSRDNSIKLWDVERREMIDELKGHSSFVQDVVFNADGSILASVGRDARVRFWELGKREHERRIRFDAGIRDFVQHEASNALLVLDDEGTLESVDLSTGKVGPANGFENVAVTRMAGTENGSHIVSVCDNLVLLNDRGRRRTIELQIEVAQYRDERPVAISGDGSLLAIGSVTGECYYGDWQSADLRPLPVSSAEIAWIDIDATGDTIAVLDIAGMLYLIADLSSASPTIVSPPVKLKYGGLCFSPDSRWLVAVGNGQVIHLLDRRRNYSAAYTLRGHGGPPKDYLFTDNGQTMISCGGGGKIMAWDIQAERRRFTFLGQQGAVAQLIRLDKDTFASMGESDIRIWQSASQQQVESDVANLKLNRPDIYRDR